MPNGHGGVPFLVVPIAYAGAAALCAAIPARGAFAVARLAVCALLAARAGWRLAYDLHLRRADEYQGAYTPPDVLRRARRRYAVFSAVYALAGAAAALLLAPRGLP